MEIGKTNDKKILACVEQSRFANPVANYAAWASMRVGAPLEFLHVLDRHTERGQGDDHTGAIGIDAQEHLIDKLTAEEAARTAAAREQGRVFLHSLREQAHAAGAEVIDVRQRHGTLEETLAEQEKEVRLLVLGHGGSAAVDASLGGNVERVVRTLHVPVLIVPDRFEQPHRVLIAFDGGTAAKRAVDMVATSPLFEQMTILLFMADQESPRTSSELAWAQEVLQAAGREVQAMLKPGKVVDSVTAVVREHAIDMVVMGAYGHSALRSLIFGSKTAELLRSVRVPTLLLR